MKFIMNRVLDNPILSKLKLSSAASYVKDFATINKISPVIGLSYTYVKVANYRALIPPSVDTIMDVYLCDTDLSSIYTENDKLSASLKTSRIPNRSKVSYGTYTRTRNVLDTDIEEGVLELYHKCLEVDELGFPTLPYDGSLMEAVTNYIKYRYFTVLWENDIMAKNKVDAAHQEYVWYIGQYTMANTVPTYDEAVSWANSWQRLLNDRNLDSDAKALPQHLKL